MEQKEQFKRVMRENIGAMAREFPGLNIDAEWLTNMLERDPDLFLKRVFGIMQEKVLNGLDRIKTMERGSWDGIPFIASLAFFFHVFSVAEGREYGEALLRDSMNKTLELLLRLPAKGAGGEGVGNA